MITGIGALRPWTDPNVTSMHRLAMHVPLSGCRRRSLDGQWNFQLFDTPDSVPPKAITGGAPAFTVAVPGNWTMQGVGDLPHYTNVQMPFPGPPPRLPERNPTIVGRHPVMPIRFKARFRQSSDRSFNEIAVLKTASGEDDSWLSDPSRDRHNGLR